MKRILLDQGMSPAAATVLCAEGWDAVHVADCGMHRAEDLDIRICLRDVAAPCRPSEGARDAGHQMDC